MQYYVKKSGGGKVAHIWTGEDTACHMASTGGLNPEKYKVVSKKGKKRTCFLCGNPDLKEKYRGVPEERASELDQEYQDIIGPPPAKDVDMATRELASSMEWL